MLDLESDILELRLLTATDDHFDFSEPTTYLNIFIHSTNIDCVYIYSLEHTGGTGAMGERGREGLDSSVLEGFISVEWKTITNTRIKIIINCGLKKVVKEIKLTEG